MYFCPQTRTHTLSAQYRLIKTCKTERFTTALEAESQGYRHLAKRFVTALEVEPQGCRHVLNTIVHLPVTLWYNTTAE